MNVTSMTSFSKSTSLGLQLLLKTMRPSFTIFLNSSIHGPFSSFVSGSSQPFFCFGFPSSCINHFILNVSGQIYPRGSYRLIVTDKTILLVRISISNSSTVSSVTSGPDGNPLLLLDTFTVSGTENLSVSVFQAIPNTAPPNFCTIGPSLSPEHATTFSLNPPLAKIWARVPVVCQLSRISPLSLLITSIMSDPLGRSSTNLSSSIINAATQSISLYNFATL